MVNDEGVWLMFSDTGKQLVVRSSPIFDWKYRGIKFCVCAMHTWQKKLVEIHRRKIKTNKICLKSVRIAEHPGVSCMKPILKRSHQVIEPISCHKYTFSPTSCRRGINLKYIYFYID